MFKKIEYPRFVYGIRIPAPTLIKYSAGPPFSFRQLLPYFPIVQYDPFTKYSATFY